MNFRIGFLVVEQNRSGHIARHQVEIKEVLEIVSGNYIFIKGREDKWLLVGKTKKKRYLTVVVGERKQKNTYGLVTARPSRRDERSFYEEFVTQIGGEENGQNKDS